MKNVQAINKMQFTITKNNALFDLITPAGISRMAVRGFFASKFLSSQRLKAMAAERAKTMHKMTKSIFIKKNFQSASRSFDSIDSKKPFGKSSIGNAGL